MVFLVQLATYKTYKQQYFLRLRDTDNPKERGLCDIFSRANFCCLFLVCRLEHNIKNHAFQ